MAELTPEQFEQEKGKGALREAQIQAAQREGAEQYRLLSEQIDAAEKHFMHLRKLRDELIAKAPFSLVGSDPTAPPVANAMNRDLYGCGQQKI